jgi:translation elongation factor EF-1alpha
MFIPHAISFQFYQKFCTFLLSYNHGIAEQGQTREHALLAYTLGIKQLSVAVNKMDDETVGYAKARYDEITGEMTRVLGSIGYRPETYKFVPISGFVGENMTDKSPNLSWYSFHRTVKQHPSRRICSTESGRPCPF